MMRARTPVISLTGYNVASNPMTSSRWPPLAGALRKSEFGTIGELTRVIYTARFADAVYVLHAFQKKTRTTAQRDIDTAKERYSELTRGQR